MKNISEFSEDLACALQTLKKGGTILYPTDTIWGIGCDATNAEAVKKIYQIKQREDSRSMLILIENPNMVNAYVNEVPEIAWQLIDVADNPLTIIYPGAKNLPANLVASDGSIGIRITTEAFTRDLIQKFRKPLVSTSANISGQPTPRIFSQISDEIKQKVDYIVSYCQEDAFGKKPSSILKIGLGGQIEIIRK